MMQLPKPPKIYEEFIARYPKLKDAWELVALAGQEGTLDHRTIRLIKLAVAIGAQKEGAVHSNVRKALSLGVSKEEIEQIIAIVAGTIGLPSTVAVYSWVQDDLKKSGIEEYPMTERSENEPI